jgi:hypothetical protein
MNHVVELKIADKTLLSMYVPTFFDGENIANPILMLKSSQNPFLR